MKLSPNEKGFLVGGSIIAIGLAILFFTRLVPPTENKDVVVNIETPKKDPKGHIICVYNIYDLDDKTVEEAEIRITEDSCNNFLSKSSNSYWKVQKKKPTTPDYTEKDALRIVEEIDRKSAQHSK